MMLLKEPWSIENDYLTPTMKMKRAVAKVKLASEITQLYDKGAPMKPSGGKK